MNQKKFTATIYLYQEKAIKSLGNKEVIAANPVELAKNYSDNNADEILLFDLSRTDEEHEKAIGLMKRIVEECEVPVIAAGNIKRFEDVKKILYAGCQKAVLNYSKESNIAITEEVSKRFGKDKIMAAITKAEQISQNRALLNEYVSELLLMQEGSLSECIKQSELPMLVPVADIPLDRLLDILEKKEIEI